MEMICELNFIDIEAAKVELRLRKLSKNTVQLASCAFRVTNDTLITKCHHYSKAIVIKVESCPFLCTNRQPGQQGFLNNLRGVLPM